MNFNRVINDRQGIKAITLAMVCFGSILAHAATSGALTIQLRNQQGQYIQSKLIVLVSVDRSQELRATTNALGTAYFANLAVGNYTYENIPIFISSDRLTQLSLTESVSITTAPILDQLTSSSISSQSIPFRMKAEDIEVIPVSPQRFIELGSLAPGVTPSGKPEGVVLGSMLDANRYSIDGLGTNLTSSGRFGMNFSNDIIQDYVITTGGHKAEIGFTPGGVFSVYTKSGTNVFAGSVFGSTVSRSWNSLPALGKVQEDGERPSSTQDWGLTFGGPIQKDRLFFFMGLNKQQQYFDYDNVIPLGTSSPLRRSQIDERTYIFSKLTFIQGPSHRYDLSLFYDPVRQINFGSAGDPAIKNEQMPIRNRGGFSWVLQHVGQLTSALSVENTIGIHRSDFEFSPATLSAGPSRLQLDAPFGESFGGYSQDRLEKTKTLTLSSIWTFWDNNHALKFGFQGSQPTYTRAYYRPSGGVAFLDRAAGGLGPRPGDIAAIQAGLQTYNAGNSFSYTSSDSLVTPSPASGLLVGSRLSYLYQRSLADLSAYGAPFHSNTTGVFIQDDWTLGSHSQVNLGGRFDRIETYGENGLLLVSQNIFSPRIGFNWFPGGVQTDRWFIYVGHLYSPLLPSALRPVSATTDGPATIRQVWIPSLGQWKTFEESGVKIPTNLVLAPRLRNPKTVLLQGGGSWVVQSEILGVWNLGATVSLKDTKDLVDTYNPAWGYLTANDLGLAILPGTSRVVANLPGLSRTYQGLELLAQKSFSSGSEFNGSYTLSSLRGNSEVGNINTSSGSNTGFASIPSLRQDYRSQVYRGYLNENVTHVIKTWGKIVAAENLTFTYVYQLRSGLRYSELEKLSGENILVPGTQRGSRQLPQYNNLDLSLIKSWPRNGLIFQASLSIFNVFNSQTLSTMNNIYPAFTLGKYQMPRTVQLGLRLSY